MAVSRSRFRQIPIGGTLIEKTPFFPRFLIAFSNLSGKLAGASFPSNVRYHGDWFSLAGHGLKRTAPEPMLDESVHLFGVTWKAPKFNFAVSGSGSMTAFVDPLK